MMFCGTSAARKLLHPFVLFLLVIFELAACQIHAHACIDPIAHGPAFVSFQIPNQ